MSTNTKLYPGGKEMQGGKKMLLGVAIGVLAIILLGTVVFGLVAGGIPIPPFDNIKREGRVVSGTITEVNTRVYYDTTFSAGLPPQHIGTYEVAINGDKYVFDARLTTKPPSVGDSIKGTVYEYKPRLGGSWSEWQPFKDYNYPDDAVALGKIEILSR